MRTLIKRIGISIRTERAEQVVIEHESFLPFSLAKRQQTKFRLHCVALSVSACVTSVTSCFRYCRAWSLNWKSDCKVWLSMTIYRRASSKWSTKENGATFVLLNGLALTRTCCAVSWDSQMPRSLMQLPFRMWSPSIGWTRSRVKDGSHRFCHVTMPDGALTSVRVADL